jgi:ankyrin repeat protein
MLNIAKIVRLLCEHHADVNAKDNSGLSPMHYCVQTINRDAAICLLNHKADINASDAKGRTPLYYTALDSYPDFDFAKMLALKRARLGKAKPPNLPPRANESQRKIRALIARVGG